MRISRGIFVAALCLALLTLLMPVEASPSSLRCKPLENDKRGCNPSSLNDSVDACTVTFSGFLANVYARNTSSEFAKRGGPYEVFINIYVDEVFYDGISFMVSNFGVSFPEDSTPITYTFHEVITGDITAELSLKGGSPYIPGNTYFFALTDLPDGLGNCSQPVTDCPYPLTPTAVQARVVVDTRAYYAPSENALITNPPVTLNAGETWWVIGAQDGFYHLFIACQARYVWVPAESLGANFDIVWNGRALPDAGTPQH